MYALYQTVVVYVYIENQMLFIFGAMADDLILF